MLETRSAGASDPAFIAALAAEVFLEYGSYDTYLLDWLEDEHVTTRIALVEGAPAGFYMLARYAEAGRKVAELLAIAVDRAHQNRGIGGDLLDQALAAAREFGADEVRLSVADGNSRAERLFASRGFRLTEGFGVYPSGQRALLMVKKTKSG